MCSTGMAPPPLFPASGDHVGVSYIVGCDGAPPALGRTPTGLDDRCGPSGQPDHVVHGRDLAVDEHNVDGRIARALHWVRLTVTDTSCTLAEADAEAFSASTSTNECIAATPCSTAGMDAPLAHPNDCLAGEGPDGAT